MATPSQQYSYKQGCRVGVPESHILDRSRSTFFRFVKVKAANRSQFFRFDQAGNRSPYCFRRLRFTLNYFTFLHFISIFILLTRRNATEALYMGQAIKQLPQPAPEDVKILLSDRNFLFDFLA